MATLKDTKYHKEQERLSEDKNVIAMATDLFIMNITSEQVAREAKFKQLNDRYFQLSGKHGFTIGSIHEAVYTKLKEIELLEALKKAIKFKNKTV